MINIEEKLNEMISQSVDHASNLIKEYGEFIPFAYVVLENGELQPHMVMPNPINNDKNSDIDMVGLFNDYDAVFTSLFSKHEILACALTTNVNIPHNYNAEYPDGIKVRFESASVCDQIYIPYTFNMTGKKKLSLGKHFYVSTKCKWSAS